MKTLVTGASGFIGSAVVRKLLEKNREVRCLVEPGARLDNLNGLDVEIAESDINDRVKIDRAMEGCNIVYHLAAIYSIWLKDPALMYRVNVDGSKNVLFAALKANVDKVVYTSSIAAVGRRRDGQPATEDNVFSDHDWHEGNGYVRSKWLSELDALRFAREGLPLVVVNPAFPFGPRDIGPTPTGGFILAALRKQLPAYVNAGFCAVDVEDVAAGHLLAEERGRVGERYILGNHNVMMKDFYTLVGKVAGVPVPKLRMPVAAALGSSWLMENWATRIKKKRPKTTYKATLFALTNHFYDASKARRELGFPVTPLQNTIEKSVYWFRQHGYVR